MTLQELHTLLKQTGLEVAYSHFNNSVKTPFITYIVNNTDNFGADNKVFHRIKEVSIELYTNKKDLDTEKLIEGLLDQKEIYWNIRETFIESEKLFQTVYDIRLI